MALPADEHAVLQVQLVPLQPNFVAIQAAAEFAIMRGTVNGGVDLF